MLALAAFAAVALVGVPAGSGLPALGAALCGLGAAHGATARRGGAGRPRVFVARLRGDAAYRAVLWLLAVTLRGRCRLRARGAGVAPVPDRGGAAWPRSPLAGGRSGRQVVVGLTLALRRPCSGRPPCSRRWAVRAGRADGRCALVRAAAVRARSRVRAASRTSRPTACSAPTARARAAALGAPAPVAH